MREQFCLNSIFFLFFSESPSWSSAQSTHRLSHMKDGVVPTKPIPEPQQIQGMFLFYSDFYVLLWPRYRFPHMCSIYVLVLYTLYRFFIGIVINNCPSLTHGGFVVFLVKVIVNSSHHSSFSSIRFLRTEPIVHQGCGRRRQHDRKWPDPIVAVPARTSVRPQELQLHRLGRNQRWIQALRPRWGR